MQYNPEWTTKIELNKTSKHTLIHLYLSISTQKVIQLQITTRNEASCLKRTLLTKYLNLNQRKVRIECRQNRTMEGVHTDGQIWNFNSIGQIERRRSQKNVHGDGIEIRSYPLLFQHSSAYQESGNLPSSTLVFQSEIGIWVQKLIVWWYLSKIRWINARRRRTEWK